MLNLWGKVNYKGDSVPVFQSESIFQEKTFPVFREKAVEMGISLPAESEDQERAFPVFNEDKSIACILDGFIFNHDYLRQKLEEKGHKLAGCANAQIVPHLYQEYGEACISLLRGPFALALWDNHNKILLLARDGLGYKPLYYRYSQGILTFASRLGMIFQDQQDARKFDPSILPDFLTLQYIPDERTGIVGIKKLLPGRLLILKPQKRPRIMKYFRLIPKVFPFDENTCSQMDSHDKNADSKGQNNGKNSYFNDQKLDKMLAQLFPKNPFPQEAKAVLISIIDQLQGNKNTASFLSGGLDSSLLSAILAKLSPKIQTFGLGFCENGFDESPYARKVAQRIRSDHKEYRLSQPPMDIFEKIPLVYDEPMGDPSAIATLYLFQLTKKDADLVYTGDGGDELFLGYNRYIVLKMLGFFRLIPKSIRRYFVNNPAGLIRFLPKKTGLLRIFAASLEKNGHDYLSLVSIFSYGQLEKILSKKLLENSKPGHKVAKEASIGRMKIFDNTVPRAARCDILTYGPGDVLPKIDRAARHCFLEIRSPFMDQRLVQHSLTLSGIKRMGFFNKKRILKAMAQGLLPPQVINKPKKGFGVPLCNWFRGPLANYLRENLCDSRLAQAGHLKQDAINQLIKQHFSGKYDHHHRLWLLLYLELWIKKNNISL